MKLLITTQVYPPEFHPTAVMARELAESLVTRGWEVTVAAGLPHAPTGQLYPGFGGRLRSVEVVNGVKTIRCWHPTIASRRFLARALVMSTQIVATGLAALTSERPDVVMSFGGPPLVGPVVTGLLARRWRCPMLTVLHDLYPDVAIEAGAVRSKAAIRVLRGMEAAQYRWSRALVVLGPGTRDMLLSLNPDLDPAKVSVIPVWLDPEEIRPQARSTPWRREHGISDNDFLVLYSGTAGLISGAEYLVEAARSLPRDVIVAVVGGGSAWKWLAEQQASGTAPANLRVIPYQDRSRLAEVQASSDLSLLTLLPGRGRTSVPSKLQGYMAAGRPVLAAVDPDCDTARVIEEGGFGRVVRPADAGILARAILELRGSPDLLAGWGRRAREAFVRSYSKEHNVDRYADLLSAVASGR